ncbi:Ndufa8, NADH-ubiquinone oxidoreductase complex I 19kd subunit [Suillus fuscotomentosus]|uniref:NADH-ubiquinone oxidoreductase n=2 Tax=Suillus TaxID=5379 RepID=A0A9P7DYV3_9AGAM|nr:Ndufa8, NADH-ubiquinone oxidoreductase complex I 19kd subunit [Suillus plorans]XP_041232459.1 Ndufa8, NADH-ubiquinone oxidoreductase complex I 19kd subunit [Suillus fuscotomentosus]KAG1833568.1 Ndufa8, NADH-ubiquinone oxidoreductase complex I 19kd subunit [Suillus variegatus]KAG1868194.1 Ndufa8, NADH-ubiquinone oxidoreductase complex I 19kd subunit [Suillus tomentosus]KAG2060226.1 Ndufa8, NADH-ubiquinone oxidoreductase complex I 19kd subunit [Suillus hirtellus]KAG1806504.1 Ndufa8, NADH-ubiq
MSGFRDSATGSQPYKDPTPLPDSVPRTQELGVTSAPLKSAAFFIGAYCKEYNEDFMLCKNEGRGDPGQCLKEGRRVTRCATDLINKMRENCLEQFDAHWNCLELNNQEYYACRKPERTLNKCMFEKLGLTKTIPGTPVGKKQIHEVEKPIYTTVQR